MGRVESLGVAPWAVSWDPHDGFAYVDPSQALRHDFVMAGAPGEDEPAQGVIPCAVMGVR